MSDGFSFSAEIEAELAGLEAQEAAASGAHTAHEQGNGNGTRGDASAATAAASSAYAASASARAASSPSAAIRAAAANPSAYAAEHFSSRPTASAASPYRSSGSAQAAVRRLSIDAAQAEVQKQAAAAWNPSASAASSSSIASSADASPEHRAFYDDDAHYFNLGGSSFPLLPHNSLYDDELLGEQIGNGHGTRTPGTPIGPEKAFSPSGRVHAQHFSSILNQPASRLQYAAGPALSGASGYLPSLSSIWTFTTGVQPPEMVSRASYELTSFAEEAQSVDSTPFVLPPCPGLNDGDIDLAVVGRYLQSMKPLMATYRKNHPREGFAHKAAVIKAREAERAQASSVQTQLRARANANKAKEKRRMHGTRIDEESDEEKETTPYGQYAHSSVAAAAPAFSSSLDPLNDDDAALSLSLARDLRACYSEIPSVYFSENFNMASLDFLAKRDPKEEALITGLHNRTAKHRVEIPGAKGGINPYASFDALSSYHNSQHFTLPSLADQKAAQLQAYRESQERLAFMHDLNEKHASLQVELSGYLDMVECNLLQQISHKSWIFFDALKHMQQISEEIALCLGKITLLRANVKTLKSNLSSAGLGVLQQIRTIDNTRRLIHKLELIATVLKTSPTVQLLLSTGDFSAGMQLIHSTKLVLSTELKGLSCLRNVQVKLDEHAKLIGSMMRLEFVGVAIRGSSFYLHDFNPAATTAQGLRGGNKNAKIKASAIAHSRTLSEEEQERLVPLVSHLLELGQLGSVFEVYREELQGILKQRLMDLVYELLNQLRDETDASAAAASKTNGKAHAEGSSDDDEEEEDSHVSEKDEVAANSLFSDAVVPPADKEEAPVAAAPTSDAAPASTTDSALSPSAAAAASQGASPPVAQPVSAASAPRYGERKQAAIAMPVGANGAVLRVPNQSTAVPSPSNAAAAAAASSSITPTAASSSPVVAPAVATAPTPALTLAAPPAPSSSPAASISSRFSSLQHSEFLNLLQPLFTSLMDLLQRASTIRHLALTVLNNSALPAPQKESLTRELNEALISLLEFTHGKIGKILQTRSGVHAELELRQLRQYLDVILNFIQEGEKMAGKTCYGLRGTLLVQAKAFLVSFHARCMQVLATSLEKEKWVRVDVPPEYQSLLDAQFIVKRVEVAAAADVKAAAAAAGSSSASPAADPFADSSSSILDAVAGSSSAAPVKASVPSWQSAEDGGDDDEKSSSAPAAVASPSLVKNESKSADVTRVLFVPRTGPKGVAVGGFLKFPVVQSLLVLLQIIGQYIECSAQLQAVGSDILNRLVELLQVFNSRSCQLVLGAGAMHLSGLKSVRTRSLHFLSVCLCVPSSLGSLCSVSAQASLGCCVSVMRAERSRWRMGVNRELDSFNLHSAVLLLFAFRRAFSVRCVRVRSLTLCCVICVCVQITASHLALASQSVGLLVTQIPVLRGVLSSRLPSKHHVLLHSLDRVSQDCQEHQREIFAKLVGIMDELVKAMRDRMEQLPWAKPAEAGAQAVAMATADASTVDECVKTLMKQTCSLHRALSDLLLSEQRDLIFRDISHKFLLHIGEFAARMDQSNATVKLKMAYNLNHIITRLKTCTGVNEEDVQQLAKFVMV